MTGFVQVLLPCLVAFGAGMLVGWLIWVPMGKRRHASQKRNG